MLLCGLVQEAATCVDKTNSPLPQMLNICPVDYVAQAIVEIFDDEKDDLRSEELEIFHLCAPKALPFAQLCEWVRNAGYPLEDLAPPAFRDRVRQVDEEHPWFALKSSLLAAAQAQVQAQAQAKALEGEPQVGRAAAALKKKGRRDAGSDKLTEEGLARALRFLLSSPSGQAPLAAPSPGPPPPAAAPIS